MFNRVYRSRTGTLFLTLSPVARHYSARRQSLSISRCVDVERRPEQASKQLRAQTPRAESPSAESVGLPALLWFHTEDYANVQLYKRWLYRHWDTQYIMEFIPNCRGGRKLCFAGYMYNKKATKIPLYSGNAICGEARTAKAF